MENIRLAFQGIWSHKLRSVLTMLGIIIGISAIITIVSTIKGTNEQIKQNLIGSGNNVVTVQLHEGNYPYDMGWQGPPSGIRTIPDSMRESLNDLSGVEEVSFYHVRENAGSLVFFRNSEFTGSVYGIDPAYFSVSGYHLVEGRGFIQRDYDEYRKVCIIDQKVAKTLFSGMDPVGMNLEIKGEPFTVIGVVDLVEQFTPDIKTMNDYYLYADTSSGSVFLPDSSWPILFFFDEPQSVAVRAKSTDDMTRAGKNVADALTESQIPQSIRRQEGEPGMEPTGFSYRSQDLLEQAQKLQDMSSATNNQLIWIASISLLVGGIGVMNIMLVSVTERTSEIGLKKALGAKRRRILWQFLTEASVLTFLGGLLGVLGGIGMAQLISKLNDIPVAVSIPAILISVVFSTLIGVIFGLLPAIKAANLNPIEALRRD